MDSLPPGRGVRGAAMRLTALVGTEVVSAKGQHLGHVVDLRCGRDEEQAGDPERGTGQEYATVSGIVFGRIGWLERLGFLAVREEVAAWSDIQTFGRATIVLSPHFVSRSPRNT